MKSGEGLGAHIKEYAGVVHHFIPSAELVELRKQIPDKKSPDFQTGKNHLIAEAKDHTSQISPEVRQLIPSVSRFRTLSTANRVERFWNPFQAGDKGKHNREHLTMVGVMASVLAAELTVGTPDAQRVVTASIIDGYLHDIMRFDDMVSSAVNLKHHGYSIAKRLPEDLQILVGNGKITQAEVEAYMPVMQQVLKYHDVPHKVPAEEEVQNHPLFKALYLADSLAMLRYLTNRKMGGRVKTAIQYIGEHATERKLYDPEVNDDPQVAALRDKYIPVMGALILLSDEKVKAKKAELRKHKRESAVFSRRRRLINEELHRKDYQVAGVLEAAQELGLIGSKNDTQPASAAASSRRTPAA